jgi:hypothetical protein
MAGAVEVWSEDQDVVSEGMLARCNVMCPKPEKIFQQNSTNVMKTPVVAAIDNVVGLVEYVLSSKEDDNASIFRPFACLKQESVIQNIFTGTQLQQHFANRDEVFTV